MHRKSSRRQRRQEGDDIRLVAGGSPAEVDDEGQPAVVGDGLCGFKDLGESLFGFF